jgi:hypothetical protein
MDVVWLTHRSCHLGMLRLPDVAILYFDRMRNWNVASSLDCQTCVSSALDTEKMHGSDTARPRYLTRCCWWNCWRNYWNIVWALKYHDCL